MMNWINNLASVQHLASASPLSHLQKVRKNGSEFAWKYANFPVNFVFINPNVCMRSGVRTFQASFCAYATVINETPGVLSVITVKNPPHIKQVMCLSHLIQSET